MMTATINITTGNEKTKTRHRVGDRHRAGLLDGLTLAAYEVYHHSLCDSLQIIKDKNNAKIIE